MRYPLILSAAAALGAALATNAPSGALGAPAVAPAINAPAPNGQAVFQRACAACHSLSPGKKLNGPSLAGVWNRPIGKAPGYPFSPALAKATGAWDAPKLDKWLDNPRLAYPGTKMITRLPAPADRAAVIAYLKTKPVK